MRRQVLRLVDDEDGVGQRPAANVGERANGDFLLSLEFLDDTALAFILPELGFDEIEVVPQRLHVGVDLLFGIAWQKADVPVGQSDDGTSEDDLIEAVTLFKGTCEREQGLACTGHTADGHKRNFGVRDGVQRKCLLRVPGLDAVGVVLIDALDGARGFVEVAEGAG